MQVKEIMSKNPQYILSTATIYEAAQKMRSLNTGFLPIGDKKSDKIVGALTDRDIVLCAVAGKKGWDTPVSQIMHKGIKYCFENDDIHRATNLMKSNKIRRLVVLNKDKRFTGVVTVGDLSFRCGDECLLQETLQNISRH